MQILRSSMVLALATIALVGSCGVAASDEQPPAASAPSESPPLGADALESPPNADWLADAELLAERLVAADANTTPTDDTATAMRLADVLVDVDTTAMRLDVIRAYWDLWALETTLRHRTTESERIDRLVADRPETPDWLVAVQAKWQALVETSRNDVASARQRLATISPAAAATATVVDVPHVGPYRTEFERLFNGPPVASYMFLLRRTMPARHRALAARGVAVDGTLAMVFDSAAAIRDDSNTSDALAWRLEQLRRQRESFVELVRRYNHDIARYALSVAPEDITVDQMVGMLVLGISEQANASNPTPEDDATRGDVPPHQYLEGTPPMSPVTKPGDVAYNLLPARPHFARTPGDDGTSALTGPGGSVGPKRVVQVARLLFAEDAADTGGAAISLADALAGEGSDRMSVVTNYWWAATAAARHRAMKGLLSELVPPAGDTATGRIAPFGWAYFAQLADVYEAEIDSQTAIHELATTSRWHGSAELRTTTTPHAGRYRTKAPRQAKWQTDRNELEQLAQQVADTYKALDLRATLYVDALRAGSARAGDSTSDKLPPAENEMPPAEADAAVRSWQRRHDTLDDYLAALGDYNVAIGQYVLAVLPEDEPTDDLVKTLVVSGK